MKTLSNTVAVVCLIIVAMRIWGGGLLPLPIDPIPGDGFRVLIVYESEQLDDYPAAQVDALYSSDVRAYLSAKCVAGATGWPDYRILDADADMALDSVWWQEAMKRPRISLPWVLIDSPQGGFEGPMPAGPDALLELLKKYGGA